MADEIRVYVPCDSEVSRCLDSLVTRGVLEEASTGEPGIRTFSVTPRGEDLLRVVVELTRIISGGGWPQQ